jgi:hypothetical protein
MKREIFTIVLATMFVAYSFAQDTLVIDKFTGNTSSGIGVASGQTDVGSGVSVISYENDQLKSEYTWLHSDWFPRTVWYNFNDYKDVSNTPFLVVKFMVTDDFSDSIPVRLDLYGDGADPYNDTIRAQMETNGHPWELKAKVDEWYTVASNFIAENRFYCTYWNGGISAVRVDSTKINGFEAFSDYGDAKYNSHAGTMYIDYLMMVKDTIKKINKVQFSNINAFGLAVYPNPASTHLTVNAENVISKVEFYDLTGSLVFTLNNVNNRIKQINTAELKKSLYMIKVSDVSGNVVTQRVTFK